MDKLIDFCISNNISVTIRKDILLYGIRFEFRYNHLSFVRCIPYDRYTDDFFGTFGINYLIDEIKHEFKQYL